MKISRDWWQFCKVLSLVGMVISHYLISFWNVQFHSFTLPILCFGVAVGAVYTRNEAAYLGRLVLVSIISQVFWKGAGLSGAWTSDLTALSLGLVSVLVEKRVKYVGVLGVVAAWCLEIQVMTVGLVYVSYLLRNDLLAWSLVVAVFGGVTAFQFHWTYLGYGLAGPLLYLGRYVKVGIGGKLGRWVYAVYPVHLAGICWLRMGVA